MLKHYAVTDGSINRILAISDHSASIAFADDQSVWYPVGMDAAQSWLRVTLDKTGKDAEIVYSDEVKSIDSGWIIIVYSRTTGEIVTTHKCFTRECADRFTNAVTGYNRDDSSCIAVAIKADNEYLLSQWLN